jgi:hypothetical protein
VRSARAHPAADEFGSLKARWRTFHDRVMDKLGRVAVALLYRELEHVSRITTPGRGVKTAA